MQLVELVFPSSPLRWFLRRPLMRDPSSIVERPNSSSRSLSLQNHSAYIHQYTVLGVPRTKSVKKFGSCGGRTVLDLNLEVLGGTTGKELMSTCRACSIRESDTPASASMVDFVAKEDLINLKNGKASVAFRFLCLPVHHGTTDEEYECATTTTHKPITYAPIDYVPR